MALRKLMAIDRNDFCVKQYWYSHNPKSAKAL